MSDIDITSMFVGAADKVETDNKTFGGTSSVYRRAAVIASNKLGRNVDEYDIIVSQLSLIEAQIAMTPQNQELYVEMVKLTFLAAKMSSSIGNLYFKGDLQQDVLARVENNIAAAMPKAEWSAPTAAE